MRALHFILIIFILTSLSWLSGCKENPDDDIVPVYLEDFTEYVPTSKSYVASDIKGYVQEYGLTDLAAFVKYDIKVYKIKYKTAFEGDSIIASGLLAVPVPKEKSDAFPMLSYQHATMTTNAESPTSNPLGEVTAMATYVASTGFVVMIPDYIGFGSSSDKFHPYMIKKYTVNAILDFIRASKEFIATEKPCKINSNLFLSGYSQGGNATMAALSAIENDTRNIDLEVKASACGAGFYNLNTFRNWLVSQKKFDSPYIIAYMLRSFKQYEDLAIEDTLVFSSKFASVIPGMIDGTRLANEINTMFGTLDVGELFNDDFENDSTLFNKDKKYDALRAVYTENSVPVWNLGSDVTLYYGKSDMIVPNEQSLKILSEFRTVGATAKIKVDALDNLDHKAAEIPILAKSVSWFKKY